MDAAYLSKRNTIISVDREMELDNYLFKSFTRISKAEFEALICMIGPKILKKDSHEESNTSGYQISYHPTIFSYWQRRQYAKNRKETIVLPRIFARRAILPSTWPPYSAIHSNTDNSADI